MKIRIPILISRLNEEHHPESDGYYDGAHNTPSEHGIEAIISKFNELKMKLQRDSVAAQKKLEARLEYVDEIAPQLELLWASIKERTKEQTPHVAWPTTLLCIGLLAIASETLILASALDIVNITDPTTQILAALGISFVVALAFHFTWDSFTNKHQPHLLKLVWRTLALIFSFALVAWGMLRGFQVGFAATLSKNPLGDFLSAHPMLSSIFYVFISFATPVVAAAASHHSIGELQLWWEWTNTKKQRNDLVEERASALKQLESGAGVLQLGMKALDEECKQNCSTYLAGWERGQSHGSVQEAYWLVPAKATFAALWGLLLAGWFIFAFSPFFFLFPVVVWWGAFLHYRRQWKSPSRVEFFALENVMFVQRAIDAQDSHTPLRAFQRSPNDPTNPKQELEAKQ
ncbi:MAG: hypothetical protein JWO13_442 [Acidobacteriales bacterium]|nr:hypothetical protein [Terriglobales bacterium]